MCGPDAAELGNGIDGEAEGLGGEAEDVGLRLDPAEGRRAEKDIMVWW